MALIPREDVSGRQTFVYRSAVKQLADAMKEERCLLFLGAGACRDDEIPDLPDAKELASELMRECGLDWHDQMPLYQAADYYEFSRGRKALNDKLVQNIGDTGIQPPKSIKRLIDIIHVLNQKALRTVAITTNYDRHFERAHEQLEGNPPKVIVYKGATDPLLTNVDLHEFLPREPDDDLYWQPKPGCSLYKIHGCISLAHDRGLVITQEDYINFLTNALTATPDDGKKILNAIKGRLEKSTILFIGYGLADWNFRALFKATVEKRQKKSKSYAVQFRDMSKLESDNTQAYWESLSSFWGEKSVDIINATAAEFTWDLLSAVQERTAQVA